MRCSGAAGTEQTSNFTSSTSGAAQLGSNAGRGCSPGRLPSLQPHVSIIVTLRLGEQCQSLERQKGGKRKKDREKGRNNLFILACAGCQPETAKGNEECARCSVRTSWVIHDVLCENASCVLCVSCSFHFFRPFSSLTPFLPPSFSLSLYHCFQELKVCFSFQWQSIPWLLNVNQRQAAGWHERLQLLVGYCSTAGSLLGWYWAAVDGPQWDQY